MSEKVQNSAKRYRQYLDTELEAAAMYSVMAAAEKDPDRALVFEKLVESEMRHASRWAEKLGLDPSSLSLERTGWKLRLLRLATKMLGTNIGTRECG